VVSWLACPTADPEIAGSYLVKGANFVISNLVASELTQLIRVSILDNYLVDCHGKAVRERTDHLLLRKFVVLKHMIANTLCP